MQQEEVEEEQRCYIKEAREEERHGEEEKCSGWASTEETRGDSVPLEHNT